MGETVKYLDRCKREHPGYDSFSLRGKCHDCGEEMEVIVAVDCDPPEIIKGGGFWHFDSISTGANPNGNFMKCEGCMAQDPILRRYQPCEVFSRVVGYLRPVSCWNLGKREEFRQRVVFNMDKAASG